MPSDDRLPDLESPTMICAFSGWNDAGEAATAAVEHLALCWDAQAYATLESEDYYDYQVNRPQVRLVEGVSREVTWPGIDISIVKLPVSRRHLVLVTGPEPNLRWPSFCDEILDVARDLGVERVILLGSMSTDAHFERPVPVTGSAWDAASAARYGLAVSRYEGPTGITGVLHDTSVRCGFPAVSLWAGTPYYISAPVWTPATIALLRKVEEVLDEPVPLELLPDQADQSIAIVRGLVESDPQMQALVEALPDDTEVDVSTADELAAEFERYLRDQDGEKP